MVCICSICNFISHNRTGLIEHMDNIHSDRIAEENEIQTIDFPSHLIVITCNKISVRSFEDLSRYDITRSNEVLLCNHVYSTEELCKHVSTTKEECLQHQMEHVKVSDYLFCTYCNLGFTENQNLIDHIRCHIDLRTFECDLCGMAFPTDNAYQQHRRDHLLEDEVAAAHTHDTDATPSQQEWHAYPSIPQHQSYKWHAGPSILAQQTFKWHSDPSIPKENPYIWHDGPLIPEHRPRKLKAARLKRPQKQPYQWFTVPSMPQQQPRNWNPGSSIPQQQQYQPQQQYDSSMFQRQEQQQAAASSIHEQQNYQQFPSMSTFQQREYQQFPAPSIFKEQQNQQPDE